MRCTRTVKFLAVVVSALCLGIASLMMHSVEFCIMAIALVCFAAIPYAVSRWALRGLELERKSVECANEEELVRVRMELRGKFQLLGSVTATQVLPAMLTTELSEDLRQQMDSEGPIDWLGEWIDAGAGRIYSEVHGRMASLYGPLEDSPLPESEDTEEDRGPDSLFDKIVRLLGLTDDEPQEESAESILAQQPTTAVAEIVERSEEGISCEYILRPLRRGVYRIGPVCLHFADPLGLFEFRQTMPSQSNLTVFPTPLRVEGLSVWSAGSLGQQQFEGVGAKGSGIEFHGIREYKPGDELRRVHWRSTARHGQLNVIEFEHSRAEDTIVAIDLTQGSEWGIGRFTTLEYAVRIAADVAEQAVSIGSLVRLACAGMVGPAASPARGRDQFYTILDALAGVTADQEQPLSSVIADSMNTIRHGADLICISSVVDDGLEKCAQQLRPAGVRLQLILVTVEGQEEREDEIELQRLAASGISVTVVEGSADRVACRVVARYGC